MNSTLRVCLAAVAAICAGLVLITSGTAAQSRTHHVSFGVADDAWLVHGPETLESRLDILSKLGPDVVRFTGGGTVSRGRGPRVREMRATRRMSGGSSSAVLRGLRRHGIDPVVTLYGTPGWANGGRAANWAPSSDTTFASFAYAAARRYPWVRQWTVWNEPNTSIFLRPTTAETYVVKLLNPAYTQLHAERSPASRSPAA